MLRRILSIDTESYGALHGNTQTCFHPRRSAFVDRPAHPLLCCSLTPCAITSPSPSTSPTTSPPTPTSDSPKPGTGKPFSTTPSTPRKTPSASEPPSPSLPSNLSTVSLSPLLATLRPLHTLVLPLAPLASLVPLRHPADPLPNGLAVAPLEAALRLTPRQSITLLYQWLMWADTLVGMNLAFDLSFLRAHHPLLRRALSGSHLLLDLSYFNYLESEVRPERSLKTLGPVLGTHTYEGQQTARSHQFRSGLALLHYCGTDTHNTVLSIAALAARIPPTTPKLSPFCLDHYSSTIWCCVEMSENGVPFHRPSLSTLATRLSRHIATCERIAATRSLILSGTGSKKSKETFLLSLIDAVQAHHFNPTPSGSWTLKPNHHIAELPSGADHIRDHPLLAYTEKRHELSFSDSNRSLLTSLLPPSHPLRKLGRLVDRHARSQKLLSSYCYPYLWHRRTDPSSRTSLLVSPLPSDPLPCPPPPEPTAPPAAPPNPATAAAKTSKSKKGAQPLSSPRPTTPTVTTADPAPSRSSSPACPPPSPTTSPLTPTKSKKRGAVTAATGTAPPTTAPTVEPPAPD